MSQDPTQKHFLGNLVGAVLAAAAAPRRLLPSGVEWLAGPAPAAGSVPAIRPESRAVACREGSV